MHTCNIGVQGETEQIIALDRLESVLSFAKEKKQPLPIQRYRSFSRFDLRIA